MAVHSGRARSYPRSFQWCLRGRVRVGGEGLSRSREDDAFRLAFTRLILDRYVDFAELASGLVPRIDANAVVVEAIRMVDESPPGVDQTSGDEVRVVPRAGWLADWVVEAIEFIAGRPNRYEDTLGRKRAVWEEQHAERVDLLGRLERLGSSREATVLTLLGWDEMDAVVALAGHGDQAVGVSLEGYRALADDGIAGFARGYEEPRLEDPEYRLGYLRWRLEALMPPLAWVSTPAPGAFDDGGVQPTPVEERDVVALHEPNPVPSEVAESFVDDVPDDEPTAVDVPEAEPARVAASGFTGWTWSDHELVALPEDAGVAAMEDNNGDGGRSDPPVPVAWRRGRVLAVAGVVATMAISAGALLAPRPNVGSVAERPTAQATAKHVAPVAKQPIKPKHVAPTSRGRGTGKTTSVRKSSPKAVSTSVVAQRAPSSRVTYVTLRQSTARPTRRVSQPRRPTNAEIVAEFLP